MISYAEVFLYIVLAFDTGIAWSTLGAETALVFALTVIVFYDCLKSDISSLYRSF
jgi:lipoprotein signal peptidase